METKDYVPIREAAKKAGMALSTVRVHCEEQGLGSQLWGRTVLSKAEVERLKALKRPRGYPKGRKRK